MALEPKTVRTPHSVKVPRLYKFCSKVLEEYFQFRGKIPKLILQLARKEPGAMIKLANKLLLALEAKLDIIKMAIENVGVLDNNPGLRYELALVIAADMLLNEVQSKRFERPCKPVLTMLEVRDQLVKEYERCLQEAPATVDKYKPRWVCVNTLLTSVAQAKQYLAEAGFSLKHYSPRSYEQFLLSVKELAEHEFLEDFHFPEVFVFSPLGLRNCHLVGAGKLLMQDKVSFLSPVVCGVAPGDVVLDACAAPGNKTTVLATLLNNDGKLICVERDEERFAVLRKRVKHHGVRCASFINQDFSSLSPEQYEGVTTVLLDPSCSNSGVALPTDEASVSEERYRRLSDMQFKLLSFALSIPSVRTVVYSTCSVNSMENENVVARALDRFGDVFELEDLGAKMEDWRNFGDESYPFAQKVLRTVPEFDLCHGFFVAKFVVRKESTSQDSHSQVTDGIHEACEEMHPVEVKEKTKKKKKRLLSLQNMDVEIDENTEATVEKASVLDGDSTVEVNKITVVDESDVHDAVLKSKKKRTKCEQEVSNDEVNTQPPKKKKKSVSDDADLVNSDAFEPKKKKKKKKLKEKENDDTINTHSVVHKYSELDMNEQNMDVNKTEKRENCEHSSSKEERRKKNSIDLISRETNMERKEKKKKRKSKETQLLDITTLEEEKPTAAGECKDDLEDIAPKKKKKKKKLEEIPQ